MLVNLGYVPTHPNEEGVGDGIDSDAVPADFDSLRAVIIPTTVGDFIAGKKLKNFEKISNQV